MLAYPDHSTAHPHVRRVSMHSQAETGKQKRFDSERPGCAYRRGGLAFDCQPAAARHERGPRQVVYAFRVLGPIADLGDKSNRRGRVPSAQNLGSRCDHQPSIALDSFAAPSSAAHNQAMAYLSLPFRGITSHPHSALDHLPAFTDRVLPFKPCRRLSRARNLERSTRGRRLMVVPLWSHRLL